MTAHATGYGGRPSPVGASIHLSPQPGSALHPGQSVIVHVARDLDSRVALSPLPAQLVPVAWLRPLEQAP